MKLIETITKSWRLLFSSNLSAKKLALTIALGVALGVMPLLWGVSIFCVVAAWVFRLNQACLQIVNFLAYPLQLALFIPFYRLGERLFSGWHPRLPETGVLHILAGLGPATVKALGAWVLVAPLSSLLLYLVLAPLLTRRMGQRAAGALPM